MTLPRVYPLLGMFVGYAVVMLANPIRQPLRDGFRCIVRFKRVWLTFSLLAFAYSVFHFATFTPIRRLSELDPTQLATWRTWSWPGLVEVLRELPLPTLEGVAGLFDNATTTYPLSALAAVLFIANWRSLHGALVRGLRKRFGAFGWLIYLVVLVSAVASIAKPLVFWRLPLWGNFIPAARLLQTSAVVETTAFIFEYLCGVYLQVYLITVCLAWIKGLSFKEEALAAFAMRRFTYVLEWAGVVVVASFLVVRLPLLASYFADVPNVLDYFPIARLLMGAFLLVFCSMQVSLVLHNEKLRDALRAHWQFLRRDRARFGWFLLIGALHFFALALCDALLRGAMADRTFPLILWKLVHVVGQGLITGWLLASWVCLFRQCETGRANQETWIAY